jgi:hypothetical protein
MPIKLTDLELDEVSLVDVGDDPCAKVAIFKRKDSEEGIMNEEEITALNEQVETLKASVDAQKAENEKLRGFLLKEGYTIKADCVEKKAPEEFIEIEGEMVAKSAIPHALFVKFQDMQKAAEISALEKRAKEELPNLKGTDLEKGLLLKAIDGLETKEPLLEVLKAADNLFAKMTEEIGKEGNQGDMLSAQEKLDQMVKGIQKEKNCSYAKAYQEAAKTKEGKALIQSTYKGE